MRKKLIKKTLKKFNWRRAGLVGGAFIILLVLPRLFSGETSDTTNKKEERIKNVEVVSFGDYRGNNFREVLGTIESAGFTQIVARNNGNIGKIFVDIGSPVKSGQIIAEYEQINNLSQIGYENAINNFNTTKISAENSILSAQTTYENTKKTYKQTKITAEQTYEQAFQNLAATTQTAFTALDDSIGYIDETLGASNKFRNKVSAVNINIGISDALGKQSAKVATDRLLQEYLEFFYANPNIAATKDKDNILEQGNQYLKYLKEVQILMTTLNELVYNTVTSRTFSEADKSGIQTIIGSLQAANNSAILSLDSSIESAISAEKSRNSSIISAENSLKSAQVQLDLAKATSENQVLSAQNQVRSAGKSKADLKVIAPTNGVITDRLITEYSPVIPGEVIFEMIDENVTPEILTHLSQDELAQVQNLKEEKIEIVLSDGSSIFTSTTGASISLDTTTQKMELRFYPSSEELAGKNLQIGSFAKVKVPIKSNNGTDIIPVSALSFEPDGAEVLVVTLTNEAQRKKVITGKIVGDSVEIKSGLAPGDKVVKYRNRAVAGEKVNPQ